MTHSGHVVFGTLNFMARGLPLYQQNIQKFRLRNDVIRRTLMVLASHAVHLRPLHVENKWRCIYLHVLLFLYSSLS